MYRPWVNRKFGIEMEMNDVAVDQTALSQDALRAAVLAGVTAVGGASSRVNRARASYYHSSGMTWDVKTDASCGYNGSVGWEVASPAMMLDDDGECAELKAVCDHIALLKPRIDRKCGLHVHVEIRDFDWRELRKLLVLWARYEPFLFELCPPSRRTNTYCPPFRKAEWQGPDGGYWTRLEPGLNETNERNFRSAMANSPRGAVNLAHFWGGGRIEFRLGAGTVNYEKIVRWVQLLLSLVQRVKRTDMPMIQSGGWSNQGFSTVYVFKMLGLAASKHVPADQVSPASAKLMAWVERRRAQFQPGARNAVDEAVTAGAYADAGRRVQRPRA